MDFGWVVAGAAVGFVIAPVVRGLIFRHSVRSGQPWRRECPVCYSTVRFILPAGRCPGCAQRLGPPPFLVEAVAAAVLALLAWRMSGLFPLLAFAWIGIIGVALAFIDVAVHRLPDRLTLTAFGGGVVLLALAGDLGRLVIALLSGLGMAACYLILTLLNPAGMGLGDGKLALSLGLALGWSGGIVMVYGAAAGFILSGLYAAALLIAGRVTRKDAIAHGPFMLLGALAVVMAVPQL